MSCATTSICSNRPCRYQDCEDFKANEFNSEQFVERLRITVLAKEGMHYVGVCDASVFQLAWYG